MTRSVMRWKAAFLSSWRALSRHELAHGRAAGCSWVTGVGYPSGGQAGSAPGTRFLGNRTDQMLSDAERKAREE
ncbi:hypothetical protein ABZ725_50065 [Streptomyces sp. NPDC006872]|uniref:hypothetical protein n=1 Tax=Streptomyces sp. NPDC006872 TaxID=3155720 RepID=UPI0033E988DE